MDDAQKRRLDALALANAVRQSRKRVREGIKDGRWSLEQALDEPGLGSMELCRVISWFPRWGPSRTRALLRSAGDLHFTVRVGDLTVRDRRLLLTAWQRVADGERAAGLLSVLLDYLALHPGVEVSVLCEMFGEGKFWEAVDAGWVEVIGSGAFASDKGLSAVGF